MTGYDIAESMKDNISSWQDMAEFFSKFATILIIVAIVGLAIFIVKKICNKIAEEPEDENGEEDTKTPTSSPAPDYSGYVGYEQLATHIKTYSATTKADGEEKKRVDPKATKEKVDKEVAKWSTTPGKTGKKKGKPAPKPKVQKPSPTPTPTGGKVDNIDDDIIKVNFPF